MIGDSECLLRAKFDISSTCHNLNVFEKLSSADTIMDFGTINIKFVRADLIDPISVI